MPAAPAAPAAPHEHRLLALILALLTVPQLIIAGLHPDMSVDGGLYTDVAMHVRDGEGLVSDVSLYHAGFPHFPHPTPIYPLWPLLLGAVGRVVDIELAARFLPVGLYTLSLVGAWGLGRALSPGPLFPRAPGFLRHLSAGHLLAGMLGLQREYFRFTTWPYTEGLAFALLMLGLWGAFQMRARLGHLLAFGAWLALLCLTRSQLFIAPVAAVGALGLVALGGPAGRRWLLPGLAGLGVVAAALGAWWLAIRAIVPGAGPLVLLRFDQAQVTTVLAPLDILRHDQGLGDLLWDRLQGVAVAWSPTGWRRSYARGFFVLHQALPPALLAAVPALRRLDRARLRAWLQGPRLFAWLFLGLLALGALATVHLPHKEGFGTWYFHRRHAAICILAFAPALLFLLRQPGRLARGLGTALFVVQVGLGSWSVGDRVTAAWNFRAPDPEDTALATWLQLRADVSGPLVVALAAFTPPEVAWRTHDVGYHWFYEGTSLADLCRMFDDLGATMLIFERDKVRGWAFIRKGKAFRGEFERAPAAPEGWEVWVRRTP